MAWFRNHYRCDRCHDIWADEWSCMCEDDCPQCGFRHMTPFDSENLTALIVRDGDAFVVMQSPDGVEHDPNYREARRFQTLAEADTFVSSP